MKLTVSQKNLKKAVSLTERVVAKNSSLPILGNILLKTENGRLKVSATNLEIGVTYIIGAKIDEVGEVAVPAKIFSDFIASINDEKIILTSKNNTVTINSPNYKTQILGFDPKDFPFIPKIRSQPIAVLAAGVFKNTLASVSDFVASSEARPELAGIYIHFSGSGITFASTDSFRLSENSLAIKANNEDSLILPRTAAVELVRICGELDEDLEIKIDDHQISISSDDFEFVSRVVDGNYPDYKKVIPDRLLSKLSIKKDELEKGLRLAGLFTSNIADVKLQSEKDKIIISAKNSQKGEVEVIVTSGLQGDPFSLSLNFHYLLDGLKNINGEGVVLGFTGAGSPLIVRPDGNGSAYTYLIMPLRQ